ncbi:hypothetical protein [Lactobacillus helveticus]|uniref:hypothetical protein n=1 Tax=Lactobacillus helveticus TaxID=1587 RepID=UPI00197B5929|nr:hypothetical protein [Lactobacillus helveticus]MBN6049180.1 hypothetical protein [Lactobacillus helveticus]
MGSTLLMANAANNAHTVYAAESATGQAGQAKSVQSDDSADKEVAQTKAGADKSGSPLGSQTGTQGTGTGADKGAQGDKSADVAGKHVPNQNQVTTHSKDTQGVTVVTHSKDTHSKVTGKTDSTSASSSSATKADSTNATSTNEYSASASNLSKTGAASTSNSTEVKTNAKYANPVETVDNNKSGNRENTLFINQRRIFNRSAVVPSAVNSAKSLKTNSSLPSQISDFKVSVTASDGSTMKNGSSFNLSGQLAHLNAINLGFTLTQDGKLTPGSTIKIPVSVTNNSSESFGQALSFRD